VVDIASGEIEDTVSEGKRHPIPKPGTAGGLRGGHARATALTSQRRSEIAQKAAYSRWNKP
jgi:hypothetical protein